MGSFMYSRCQVDAAAALRRAGRCGLRLVMILGLLSAALARGQAEMKIDAALAASAAEVIRQHSEYWKDGVRHLPRPIDLEMVVLAYDPAWGGLWSEVEGISGYIPCQPPALPLRPFSRVRVQGTVVPVEGLSAETLTVTLLEEHVDEQPIDIRGRVRQFNEFKGRLVTLEGTVDRQSTSEHQHFIVEVVAEGLRVHVYHWTEQPEQRRLPDGAVVRLTGVYNPKHDSQTEVLEIDLWVPRPEDFVVIGNLDSDPRFQEPLSAIEELSPFMTARSDTARIVGVVHAFRPGRITVRDHTGQMVVQTLQRLPVQIGEVVEAVGTRFTGGADWLLRDAVVRRAPPEVAEPLRRQLAVPRRELRLAEQILMLTPEEAAEERPVELVGVVIRSRVNSGSLYLRDTSGCVRVDVGSIDSPMLKTGTGIRLRGVTVVGAFAPEVRGVTIEHWGTALLPEPRPITLEQAMTGSEQGERVEMRGCVTAIDADAEWTRLTLSTATGEFTAILASEHDFRWLLGSAVAARGICQVTANARRQLTGIELWLANGDDIQVEQQALSDPFLAPLRGISALRQFSRQSAVSYWARVRGVVTHHLPGRLLFVQDGATGLLILSRQGEPLAPGDLVEATGIPGFENERMILRDGVYRKIGYGEEPASAVLPVQREIQEDLEDALVRAVGTLINLVVEQGEAHLLLEANDRVFGARLPLPSGLDPADQWPIGSELAVTGVYELMRDERRQADGFRLLLRAPADVALLRAPPWLTPERGLLVAGGLCVCVLGGFGWATLLRRRVQQQTRQLRDQFAREARLEARHHDIFAKASDFIFTTDGAGWFTSFNPAGERITGYPRAEALGLNLHDLIVREEPGAALPLLETPQEGSVTFQTRLRRRDGECIWAEISARWLHESGEYTGLLGVARDISQRKQVEEELKRARDAAEANTQAKSVFLANMSHEIRTPMNGVIGMSNLLLDTPLSAEQRSFAETIRLSGEALLTVLNDILDFSKMEAGKLQLEQLEFDLGELIEEAVELAAERAASKGLELAAVVPPDLPRRVCGDPGRIRQVLLNLLGNALKFTERGEVVLAAGGEAGDGRLRLRIEVTDTGIGLTEAEQQQLFRPFMQADSSTTRRFGGTGLGLAICKQIVELMGGSIGVKSRPGAGCTFWIELDLEHRGGTVPPLLPAWAAGLRVLLVTSHASSARAVTEALATWQIPAVTVTAAPAAMAALAAPGRFGVVLLDDAVAGRSGLELAVELQASPGQPPPVILLRAFGVKFAASELAAAGVAATLKKPVRRRELLEALQRALGVEPAVSAASSGHAGRGGSRAPVALRILVAEDNAVNQRLIVLQLAKLGHQAELTGNGREALAALKRATYDLVLMDCQMPELDGYATTQEIRRNPSWAGLRVVAMTANAMRGDREKCLAAGMDDYIAKPVRLEALEVALQPTVDARLLQQER